MTRQDLINRAKNIPKRTLVFGGISIAVLIVLIIVVSIISTQSATRQAQSYNKAVDQYVASLAATNRSINSLKPLATKAPTLESAPLGFVSGEYRQAQRKAEVMTIFQNEVLATVSSYDDNAAFAKTLADANNEFAKTFDREKGSIDAFSEDGPFSSYKNAVKQEAEQRLNATKKYRDTIAATKPTRYYESVKAYQLRQLDNLARTIETRKKEVTDANSYAQIRAARYKLQFEQRSPRNEPNYAAFAINTAFRQPYRFTAPAVNGLKTAITQVSQPGAADADVIAYRALYGSMATYNTPQQSDDVATVQRKLAVANYALDTLANRAQTFSDDEREATLVPVRATQKGLGDISFNEKIDGAPSAASRMSYAYQLTVKTGDFTGYQDLLRNIENSAKSRDIESQAKYDLTTFNDLRTFSKSTYPSDFYKKEVDAYDKAMTICTNVRVSFYKKAQKPLEEQLAVGQKVNGTAKAYRDLYISNNKNPSPENEKKLDEYSKTIKTARDKIEALDQPVKADEATQQQDLQKCLPALGDAQKAFAAKTQTNAELYSYILTKAKEVYSKPTDA